MQSKVVLFGLFNRDSRDDVTGAETEKFFDGRTKAPNLARARVPNEYFPA